MTIIKTRRPVDLSRIYLAVACFIVAAVHAQSPNRVVVDAPAQLADKRLHIRKGITNAEYRKQILALTPLGNTYKQVTEFVEAELQTETHPSDSLFDLVAAGQRNTARYIELETFLHKESFGAWRFTRNDFQEQPPHARVIASQKGIPDGMDYMFTAFQKKPLPLGAWINVKVLFIFNDKHELIDAYCFAGGRDLVGP